MHHARNHTGHRIGQTHQRAVHNDATVRRARQMHDEGHSCPAIARALGLNKRTVYDWLRYTTRWNA